jgi:hypothetical protein
MRPAWWCWGLLLALPGGCERTPERPANTGAEEVARAFYEGILQRDWARAHAALHPDSQSRCGPAEFARRAQEYRRSLGFEPEAVSVRFCEENGAEAVAHVAFSGQAGPHRRYFKDAVTLRQGGQGWGVVLPPRFGQPRPG